MKFKIISGNRAEVEATVNKYISDPGISRIERIDTSANVTTDKTGKLIYTVYIWYWAREEESS